MAKGSVKNKSSELLPIVFPHHRSAMVASAVIPLSFFLIGHLLLGSPGGDLPIFVGIYRRNIPVVAGVVIAAGGSGASRDQSRCASDGKHQHEFPGSFHFSPFSFLNSVYPFLKIPGWRLSPPARAGLKIAIEGVLFLIRVSGRCSEPRWPGPKPRYRRSAGSGFSPCSTFPPRCPYRRYGI